MSDSSGGPDEDNAGFTRWAPIYGRWELERDTARYLGPSAPPAPDVATPQFGILLAPELEFSGGTLATTIRFAAHEEPRPQGRLLFGFDPLDMENYAAGLGGYESLYVVERFEPGSGWRALRQVGSADEMRRGVDYEVEMTLAGVSLSLRVNGASVSDVYLPQPLDGWQCGLTAWGHGPVEFRNFRAAAELPQAFVVMKFGEPYDAIYQEVIQPVTAAAGYDVVRADEFSGPGIIVEDIVRAIREADVVIAEVTPVNANVFYELGYAHALGKPTVLLAERGQSLPFDVSGWRAIFYDNTIAGRRQVEEQLRRHLANIS